MASRRRHTRPAPCSHSRTSSQASTPQYGTCVPKETAHRDGSLRRRPGKGRPSGAAAGRSERVGCGRAGQATRPTASVAASANGCGSPRPRAQGRRASPGRTHHAGDGRCLRSPGNRACGRSPVPARMAGRQPGAWTAWRGECCDGFRAAQTGLAALRFLPRRAA